MKKIIHLIPHMGMGGAETLVKDYAMHFNNNNYETIVVTTGESLNSINEQVLLKKKIKTIFLGDTILYEDSDSKFQKMIKRVKRYKLFREIIKNEQPDIVHSHLGVNDYLIGLKWKYKNIKFFHTLHNEVSILFRQGRLISKTATKFMVKHHGMVLIALHDRMRREAEALFETENCTVLNNTIDIDRFSKIDKDEKLIKHELKLPEDSFVVGHVGRFATQKNHDFLIDVFNEIKNQNDKAVLILIGEGELEAEVRHKVKQLNLDSSVHFLGLREDIPELMFIMDVFVFPSIFEGFGNVLLEAQAAKTKCVVSDRVPNETNLTNYITYLSLEQTPLDWSREALKLPPHIMEDQGLMKHDINNVIKDMITIYNKY